MHAGEGLPKQPAFPDAGDDAAPAEIVLADGAYAAGEHQTHTAACVAAAVNIAVFFIARPPCVKAAQHAGDALRRNVFKQRAAQRRLGNVLHVPDLPALHLQRDNAYSIPQNGRHAKKKARGPTPAGNTAFPPGAQCDPILPAPCAGIAAAGGPRAAKRPDAKAPGSRRICKERDSAAAVSAVRVFPAGTENFP